MPDYTQALKPGALKGARLGIARDFMGQDEDVDWVMEASFDAMRRQGATLVDVALPKWLLDAKGEYYSAIRYPEFVAQIADYLKATGPKYPKNINDLIDRARQVNAPRPDGSSPNPGRWTLLVRESKSGSLADYQYTAVRDHALPLVRAVLDGILAADRLDAIVYPTAGRRPPLISAPSDVPGGSAASGSNLANLSGFPDLIVPAGFTTDDLPVGISFLGPAFSEARLLALGYGFEQVTRARRLPRHTPLRTGDSIGAP
jgi:amidase